MKRPSLTMPPAEPVMLHACCAPCSSAIVEWMLNNNIRPVVYFFNPNITPYEEYAIRRDESRRHAQSLGIEWVEGPYGHDEWLSYVSGLEDEPERGARCLMCFKMRLLHSARAAQRMGAGCLTTTLASSRWKSQQQLDEAGAFVERETGLVFWHQNWRKDGLSERRAALLREFAFYNQTYCGCEFSLRQAQRQKENEK